MQFGKLTTLGRSGILALALTLGACGGGGSSAPVVRTLSFTTRENVALQGQLTASDPAGGTVSFTKTSGPSNGTLTSFTSAGAFVYAPNKGFSGADSFQIVATDSAGRTTSSTVSITVQLDHAPTAANVILRADATALASIDVLSGAKDPDADPLTVTITQTPLVGTATVNANGSVSITGLPGGFKGLTRFQFQVTDPSGESAVAEAAVFVGADPFRATFVGDAAGNGSDEVYLTNFAADPLAVTSATQGTVHLKGYAVSMDGTTVVYRSQDSASPAVNQLFFVETAAPTNQVSIPLPSGAVPIQDAQGRDQFRVSADGRWIAFIAGQNGSSSVYIVNVSSPTTVSKVNPSGAVYATMPAFSPDSKSLYFLASGVAGGANKSLYFVNLSNPGTTALISAASAPGSTDDVERYSISTDQTRIVEEANRNASVGLYFIDPKHLQTEVLLNQPLGAGESIVQSTVGLPSGSGGGGNGNQVAYTVQSASAFNAYVANVSSTPDPALVAAGGLAIGFRPDEAALLYSKSGEVFESVIGSGTADQAVGTGGDGWYDSTGNIVLLEQFLPSGGTPSSYPVLAQTVRGSFGTTRTLGTPVEAAQYFNITGFDRGVVLLGEGPTTGSPAPTIHLALVNALAPTDVFYLASFDSPASLTSDIAQVVTE